MGNFDDILSLMNYNLTNGLESKKSGIARKSSFPLIQDSIISFASDLNLTEEQISALESNVVTSPMVFDNPSMYSGLNSDIYTKINGMKENKNNNIEPNIEIFEEQEALFSSPYSIPTPVEEDLMGAIDVYDEDDIIIGPVKTR